MRLGLVALIIVGAVLGVWLLRAEAPENRSGEASPPRAAPAAASGSSLPDPTPKAASVASPAPVAPAEPIRQLPRVTLERVNSAPAGAFSGRVISATTGEGIRGAAVTLAAARGATSLVTDAEGRFEFRPPAPGVYQVAAIRAEGFLPFGPEWGRSPIVLSAVPGVQVREVVIALTPTPALVGLVLGASGDPVSGATVRVLTQRAGETVLFPLRDRFTSNERGEFHFTAPEGASVEARHPTHGMARARVSEETLRTRRLELRFPAEAEISSLSEARLEGRVLAPDGTGISGALVSAASATSAYPRVFGEPGGYQTIAEEDGSFTLEGLEPGVYDVSGMAAGLATARAFDVRVPASGLVLRLEEGGALVGRVTEEGGAPVPAFVVDVRKQHSALEWLSFAQSRFIDAEGHYAFRGLTPGRYLLQVVAAGFVPAEQRVEVPPGAREVRAEVVLTRGARLAGKVVSAGTKAPIAGARVSVESGMGSDTLAPLFDAVSGADGAFTLEGIPREGVTLSVSAPGHNTRILSGVQPSTPVVAELTPTEADAGPTVELVGIGAVLKARDDALVVGEVLPGGGAHAAGLAPGDELVRIDGTLVTELGFTGAIHRIRGPEGTQVVLGVRKAGQTSVTDMPVPRKKIGG